ncbi:MAG: hydroxymethylbilane synthase [Thermoleophilia bacterium]
MVACVPPRSRLIRLVIATRRSPLALTQTGLVADALRAAGHEVDLLEVVTTGDRWSAAGAEGPVPTRGLFVKELEQALLDGRADLAVHSAKDLPADLPEGLAVLAVPPREDPRDVLVGHSAGLAGLPTGAMVGTGSPRREAQLRAARPDLGVVPVRGNVGTRLNLLETGELDALVLAAAGLNRLGIDRDDIAALDPAVSTPAPGQGLLALEGVPGSAAAAALAALDDPAAHACLRAERRLLQALGGGCMQPVGALASVAGEALTMVAFAGSEDGLSSRRAHESGRLDDPEGLADRAAVRLQEVRA